MIPLFNAVWRYRGFVISSVLNEFRSRLTRSRFGTAWIVLHPLAMVLIYTVVLSEVLAAKLQGIDNKYAYAVYLMSGTLCWSLFSDIVQRCVNVFIDNASLLKKIQFPRICLPAIAAGSALVGNLALAAVILVLLSLLGFWPGWNLLWLPVLMVLTLALATGIGLLLGTLNVFARDIGQVVIVLMQFWFWVTPIIYPIKIVPEAFRVTLALNPVVPLVMGYHDIFVYKTSPTTSLWPTVIAAVFFLALSLFLFRRASAEMVDVL